MPVRVRPDAQFSFNKKGQAMSEVQHTKVTFEMRPTPELLKQCPDYVRPWYIPCDDSTFNDETDLYGIKEARGLFATNCDLCKARRQWVLSALKATKKDA